jgi:hypothetical protein
VKLKMTFNRETKGTFVYKNDSQDAAIKSLYVTRGAVQGDAPKEITVEIKELK